MTIPFWLITQAALEKITELQFISPDPQKSELLRSLNDEINLLTLVTKQVLEEKIAVILIDFLWYRGKVKSGT